MEHMSLYVMVYTMFISIHQRNLLKEVVSLAIFTDYSLIGDFDHLLY